MSYSDEQKAFIFSDFEDIAVVMAYAGTGKSYTLKQFAMQKSQSSFLYFVYNQSMRVDALRSFKGLNNVEITTFHGFARKHIGQIYKRRLQKNENSNENIRAHDLERFVLGSFLEDDQHLYYAHGLLITFRDFLASKYTVEDYVRIHKKRTVLDNISDEEMLPYVLSKLPVLWNEISDPDNESLPLEHDVYLKAFQLKKINLKYDYVLTDEAQDISHVMIDIVMSQKKSKKIFVGDTYQSIYRWRGAVNSLEYLEQHNTPDMFFLSKSFRCPPNVAYLANKVINLLGAKKEFIGIAKPAPVIEQKTYIARTNGGLFDFCANNLDKKIYFVGGIKSYSFADIIDIKNLLSKKHDYISSEYIKSFPDFKAFLRHTKATKDISLISATNVVLKYMKYNLYTIVKAIKEATTKVESEADYVITTCHKSKGLEWNHVLLLDDFPLGNQKKMMKLTQKDIGEELRLLYVAITRAKNSIKIPFDVMKYIDVEAHAMNSCLREPMEYKLEIQDEVTFADLIAEIDSDGTDQSENARTKKDDNKNDRFSDDSTTVLCGCKFCGKEAFINKSIIFCENCDFEISIAKIEKFYTHFGKDFNEEVNKRATIMSMMGEGGYRLRGMRKKSGELFDGEIGFVKDEKYGYVVGFIKKSYQYKKPTRTKKFNNGRHHNKNKQAPAPKER